MQFVAKNLIHVHYDRLPCCFLFRKSRTRLYGKIPHTGLFRIVQSVDFDPPPTARFDMS